jgi:hypothetical protein
MKATKTFEYKGKQMTVKQLADLSGVPSLTLRSRLFGCEVVTADHLKPSEPRKEPRRVRFAADREYCGLKVGNTYTVSEIARAAGLNSRTMHNRLRGLAECDERHLVPARGKNELLDSPIILEAETESAHLINVRSRQELRKPLIDQRLIKEITKNKRIWR